MNGCTWLWLPYLYAVEIVPTKCTRSFPNLLHTLTDTVEDRGQVNSIGNATFWLVAFIEVYAAPIALDRATGAKIFIWYVESFALLRQSHRSQTIGFVLGALVFSQL